jgi:hypothetical protein
MTAVPVTIVGYAYYTDLGVGGGPMPGGPSVTPPIYYPPAQPPGIWPSPGHPAHPIAPGGPPPTVSPPIYYPPYPDQGLPPFPAHPIAPGGPGQPPAGGQPPGIWPSPGHPAHPIVLPPGTIPGLKPEHPIYIPPASPGAPTHPIVIPPPGSTEPPQRLENWEVKAAWTEQTGWVVVIVPTEEHPGVPTPSIPETPPAA